MKKDFANIKFNILFLIIMFFTILPMLLYFHIGYNPNKSLFISKFYFTDNNIIIEIDKNNVGILTLRSIDITYNNIPEQKYFPIEMIFTEEVKYNKNDSKLIVTIKLDNIITDFYDENIEHINEFIYSYVFYINEEAEIYIRLVAGYIYGKIIIDSDNNITILDQRFMLK